MTQHFHEKIRIFLQTACLNLNYFLSSEICLLFNIQCGTEDLLGYWENSR